jgi:nitrate reductase NapAB chaperone NapD
MARSAYLAVDEIMLINVDLRVYISKASPSGIARSQFTSHRNRIMIASVVATLEDVDVHLQTIIDTLTNVPCVELGEFGDNAHRIPITIDSPAPNALEETTRLIQECRGVAFVDVVFVHFEDSSENASANCSGKPDRS